MKKNFGDPGMHRWGKRCPIRCTRSISRVGAIIRARRRQMQMTLQELGDSAGVSVGYLSQVERDHATPSLGTLAQVARALDVGIDYFIATPNAQGSADPGRGTPQVLGRRIVGDL